MLAAYRTHVAERDALGIPPLPLSATQTAELIELIKAHGAETVGVAAIVNRSNTPNPFADLDLPLSVLAEVQVDSFEADDCPLCTSNEAGPAIKPGSRPVAAS